MATSWVRALRCSRLQLAKQIRSRYMEKKGNGIQAFPYRGASARRWDMLGESSQDGSPPIHTRNVRDIVPHYQKRGLVMVTGELAES